MSVYHLHGDNIVECERTILLIKEALSDYLEYFEVALEISVCPKYSFKLNNISETNEIILFPGYERWNFNILDLIRYRGGVLREAADVILTKVDNNNERPIIAIEYCGALPAGNQAWQRSGRAYSFGKSKILYLYIAELGGYELGENRERKAARMPNPAVPFSYISFSLNNITPTLPIFIAAPGADNEVRRMFASVFAENELKELIRNIFIDRENSETIESIRLKTLNFVELRSSTARTGETLAPTQWKAAYELIKRNNSFVDYLVANIQLQWAKTAYIKDITDSAQKLMLDISDIAIGMSSSKLPICIISYNKIDKLKVVLQNIYGSNLSNEFTQWICKKRNLTICWVMGFKPKGDDARPDRGLPPLTRMLAGENKDILTIVYGPALSSTWEYLDTNPIRLFSNGLWESIFAVSDALLIDSSTDNVKKHGYLKSHWSKTVKNGINIEKVIPKPIRIGENDVDTIIHLILAHYSSSYVFEGMCNPPGGDWSGISLQSTKRDLELRWLTLPRVSNANEKRPDHVFQLFLPNQKPIIICVESKETDRNIEENIGFRLKSYIKYLLKTTSSVEKSNLNKRWEKSTHQINESDFDFAAVAAFISNDESQINRVKTKANCDLLMAFFFINNGEKCNITLYPISLIGQNISNYLSSLSIDSQYIQINMGVI